MQQLSLFNCILPNYNGKRGYLKPLLRYNLTFLLLRGIVCRKGGDGMKINKMALCAMFSALICICAWLAIPIGDMVFTMQTFGIFLCLCLLGGKYGSISIFVYLLLGAVGLPVFSGFRGGIGVLLGTTGGYIWGFLCSGLVFWLITERFGQKATVISLIAGILVCYMLGSLWFINVYADKGIAFVFAKCVLPYILPDAGKITLAYMIAKRLRPHLP